MGINGFPAISMTQHAANKYAQWLSAKTGHFYRLPTEAEWDLMGDQGLLQRQDQQYHWFNHGYSAFDDFLAALSSGRRKTIRRERRDALAEVEVVSLTGADLKEEHWDAFYGFYTDTGARLVPSAR